MKKKSKQTKRTSLRARAIPKGLPKSKRALWDGNISFGLINIPVTLHSAEKKSDLSFHLLDKKNHARIHYERVNEITGKKVAWQNIVKGYEYEKGNYVIIEEEQLAKLLPQNGHAIDIENFIPAKELDVLYYERPYYLAPTKFGNKGYVLLRETLAKTQKIAIGRVMIRTRQYLAAIIPQANALILDLLRYPEEVVSMASLSIPEQDIKSYKISGKEMDMAEKLVKNMTTHWNPKKYPNQNRDILMTWIEKKVKGKKIVSPKRPKAAQGNVVDFMELLKKSMKPESELKTPKKPQRPSRKLGKSKPRPMQSAKPRATKTKRNVG